MTLKALVFDIDGVLLDHENEKGHDWTINIENDLNISKETVEQLHKNAKQWHNLSLGQDKVEEYFAKFLEEHNITKINAMQLVNYFINNDTNTRYYMFDEVKKLTDKNYQLYIGTHQIPEKGQRLWFIEDFNKYFIKMFTSYTIGYMKHELQFFEKITNELNLLPNEIMLIDDKKKNVDTAIKAGWQGYLYTTFEDIKENLFNRL